MQLLDESVFVENSQAFVETKPENSFKIRDESISDLFNYDVNEHLHFRQVWFCLIAPHLGHCLAFSVFSL